ncbi:ABC transporter permease [Mesorhizobium shangrilense]|uniref:ABC transporter permease n=1 Tax=Mesorhizobium shangrilense TaxID=460060 RepID=A0ABV2DS55_9HYPH
MYRHYLAKRAIILLTAIWAAATINFLIPHMSPKNPIAEKLTLLAATSGISPSRIKEMSEVFSEKFGLNKTLWEQYVTYLWNAVRFDFGPSIISYPTPVSELIGRALPWTLGLLFSATVIAFAAGTLLGAAAAKYRRAGALQALNALMMVLSALPFYLVGLVLIYLLAATTGWFPVSGGYDIFSIPTWSWSFALEVLDHSVLPALSIVIASVGVWAIGMRGMMISVQGEDYVEFARARGLKPSRIFFRYGIRTAILPQVTALALSMGQIVAGAILVEVVFGYPGVGTLLFQSISLFDYPTIYGIVLILVVTVAASMFIVDLIAPWIDPRIRVEA